MSFINEKKQKAALLKHAKDILKIKFDYHMKEKYTIHYADEIVEKEKYRFSVKAVMEKYSIANINILMFLLNRAGENIGTCYFCEEDILVHSSRTSENTRSCNCVGKCNSCGKAFSSSYGSKSKCYQCEHKETPHEEQKPLIQEEKEQYWLDNIDHPLFYAENSELCGLDPDNIAYIIKFLSNELKRFKQINSCIQKINKKRFCN